MHTTKVKGRPIGHGDQQLPFWTQVERMQWEPRTFEVIERYVKPGKGFVDIGAWNGVFSLFAQSIGADWIEAVEPDPKAFEYLSENISLNPGLRCKIKAHTCAIWSESREKDALFSVNGDWGNSMSSLVRQDPAEPKGTTAVSTETLSHFIEKTIWTEMYPIESIGLIKIDIEGAEAKVIPQAREFLEKHRPRIYLSLHSFWFPDYPADSLAIAETIFPIYHVLLDGQKEISRDEFIILMDKKDCADVLLLPRQRVGLLVTCYNRPNYLHQCIDSLLALNMWPEVILFNDDNSTDAAVEHMLDAASKSFSKSTVVVSRKSANRGIKASLMDGIERLFDKFECDTVINLDSDAVVTPDFIRVLMELRADIPAPVITGFNSASERNPIIQDLESNAGYLIKAHANGINMCFGREAYNDYIKPALEMQVGNWDFEVSKALNANNHGVVVAKPSLVEHIGLISSMGHTGHFEHSADFKPLLLNNVTLFGIDAADAVGIQRAAEICQQHVRFGDVKIITERMFPGETREQGRVNYSRFMIKDLNALIDTEFVLTIHTDGYVINWKAWNPDFLKYDYIGATWGYKDGQNVGNGGFSLRSKRLLHILANDEDIVNFHPEDDMICRRYRSYLEQGYGIKFAPEEVANRFSIEAYGSAGFDSGGYKGNRYSGQFGFHGLHVDQGNYADYGIDPSILYSKSRY